MLKGITVLMIRLYIHETKTTTLSFTIYRDQLEMNKRLNTRPKALKLLKENIRKIPQDIGMSEDFFI